MDVFAYGTLLDPDRVAAVLDDWAYVGKAVVDGLHRVDGTYPTLAPGGSVVGRLLRTTDVDRLDAYEGVDAGLYVRVPVPRAQGSHTDSDDAPPVTVYVGDPDRLDAPASWPGDGAIEARARRYLDANEVTVRVIDDE